jgi:F-type H+-transporting ATPase subunit b
MSLLTSALLSGGSIIDLDGTMVVVVVIFFLAFFTLRSLVFRPMMALFDERERAIDGARREAKEMERTAQEKAARFEEEMRKIRLSAGEERERLRKEGVRLQQSILERVREETVAQLGKAQEEIAREGGKVRAEIQANVPSVARLIVQKLLQREVQ